MAQTRRIHCVSDHEPVSYHDAAAYSVNLNIECEADVIDDSGASAARQAFGQFLDALPSLEFHVYEVKGGAQAHHIGSLPAVGAPPTAGTAAILAWLDGLNPDKDPAFWLLQPTTAVALDRKDRALECTQAGATHSLRGSQSWSAPVGHGFGLTRLLDAKDVGDPALRQLVVLPHSPGFLPTSPVPIVKVDAQRWDATYAFDNALGDVVCRTNLLQTQTGTPGFLTPEGFLKVNANAVELHRFIDAFGKGWAGIAASLAAVLPQAVSQDDFQWTIAGPQDANPGSGTFAADVPAWRVIAGLTAALDPLIIALLRPGSAGGDPVAGELLLPLVKDVLDAAAEMPPDKLELTAGQVVHALRRVLQFSPLLKATPTRREFIGALRDVHAVGGAGDGMDAARRLFGILLDATANDVVRPRSAPLSWDEVKLLARFHSDAEGVKTANGFAQDPCDVVIDAIHRLNDEAGAERAVLRLFATAAAAGGATVPDLLWKELVPSAPAGDADHEEFRRKLLSAWNAYGSLLEGTFNGAEAIRRSASADFLDALLREASGRHAEPAPADLLALIEAADFFAIRVAGQNTGVFGSIAAALPKPRLELLGTPSPDLKLGATYASMLASLREVALSEAAFVAEDAPAALPIQVSASLNSADLDAFSSDFNGICVALRRVDHPADPDADAWSHAHLAALSWKHGSHEGSVTGLRQWLPAAQDSRAPSFIEYQSFPFASRTIARVTTQVDTRSEAEVVAGVQFLSADVAAETEFASDKYAPLPRLVYGRRFEAFSFATTNSGSLPKEIRSSPDLPWIPKPRPTEVSTPLVKTPCSRRTSIGTTSIDEDVAHARFGVAIDEVRPLAADYPRIALQAGLAGAGSVDLMRESDGSGILAFPAGGGEHHVDLADFVWTGGKATVRVLFIDKVVHTGRQAPVMLEFADFDPAELGEPAGMTLTLGGEATFHARLGSQRRSATRAGAQDSLWWVRIQLESSRGVNVAFADPVERSGARRGVPLLLMVPSDIGWKSELPTKARATITSARVGFLDFERWYGNPDLLSRTFKGNTGSGRRLLDWLLLAYVRRAEALRNGSTENIASALDRLPDPAVEQLRLELVCLDTLNKASPPVPDAQTIDLKIRLAAWAAECKAEVEAVRLPDLRELLEKLSGLFSLRVEIEATGPTLSLVKVAEGSWKVNVPAGVVAELRVSSLVPRAHFEEAGGHPTVIHTGIAQAAVREGDWYVFAGNTLRIETMLDGLAQVEPIALAGRVISCRPQVLTREYSVISNGSISDDEVRRRWRLVSDVAVTTQSWFPGGLPVYSMIDPRDWADGTTPSAALPLRNPDPRIEKDMPLCAFEDEIFLGRVLKDADTADWKSVDPQMPRSRHEVRTPACTVLQVLAWEAPSATYYRHRFQLKSRYAGALTSPKSATAPAWPEGAMGSDAWTRRVAMLADRSRVLVTRPQMRALMPLTTSPHDSGTPPVIAFLQEPPFSEGGLADRVAADLRLGFGFGFASGGNTVGIRDARKEFGPDPRLDYRRIPDSQAVAFALATEGPVGLTHDTPRAGAASFSNSIISMVPARADGDVLNRKYEEHFVGVSLRRYLAPGWLAGQRETTDSVAASQCHWFELAKRNADELQVLFEHGATTVVRTTESSIEVSTALVDPSGSAAGIQWVAIAPYASGGRYALLHSPVAPGRYSASLFLVRERSVPDVGITNQPLLVASFEWSPPKESDAATVRAREGKSLHCVSSAPTFQAWSHTARDFHTVPIVPQDLWGTTREDLRARDLVARIEKGTMRFETMQGSEWKAVTAQASSAGSKFPLEVHRHLAIVGTRVSDGMGRPVHVFAGSAMVAPNAERFAVPAELSDASQLHLVEYESPARILGAAFTPSSGGTWVRMATIPDAFATSYFDLPATGGGWDRDLRLFVRFVSQARRDHLANLAMRIEWPDEKQLDANGRERVEPSVDPCFEDINVEFPQDRAAVGAELLIRSDTDGTTSISVALILADGLRRDIPAPPPVKRTRKHSGFLLSFAAAGEFWTDISMLHFPKGQLKSGAAPFSFDLLFSPASDSPPAEAVQAPELAKMVEAQARIVSMSPAISVVPSG